jgi:hypothetical protein
MIRWAAILLFAGADGAGVDLPRIGCWNEPAGGAARVLYGVPGNLVVRSAGEDGCENPASFGEPDENGVRTLRINAHWRLAESAAGERYLLHRESRRYELPR